MFGSGHVRRDGRRARILAVAMSVLLVPSALVALAQPAHASDASTIVSLTNAERAERGLPRYSTSGALAAVAQKWSQHMAASGELAHNPRLTSQVSGYKFVGENVGYGPSTTKIFNALMNSTAHRHNILDRDFTQIGVGTARDGNGRLWITQVFREPTGSSSPAPAPTKTTKKKVVPKKPAASPSKPKPAPKKSVAPKPKPKPEPTVKAVTSSGDAQAPAAAKPAAAPVPTFAERLSEANQFAEAAGSGDPVASTMAFDHAMRSLAG